MLHDDPLPQLRLIDAQEEFNNHTLTSRSETLRKLARNRFIGKPALKNNHVLRLVVPDSHDETVNNTPAATGMLNSMPVQPLILLPQSFITTPKRTVKAVKGHMAG